MKYKCLPLERYKGKEEYAIIPIRKQDMESIRQWRNKQLSILRQKEPVSAEEQKDYFEQVIAPSFNQDHPPLILFSVLYQDRCIGYGGLVHIDWQAKKAEVSFLVNPEHSPYYFSAFTHFLSLIRTVAMESLNMHRLFTETYAFRTEHIAILEQMGFQLEGRLREHIFKEGLWHDALIHGLLDRDSFFKV